MTYKIQKGIPIPEKKPTLRETLSKIKVGESFYYPSRFRNNVYRIATEAGVKVTIRFERKGVRVWKVGKA